MASKEECKEKPTPARPNKPKLQRRPLTQTTGDGLQIPSQRASKKISRPLSAGFVLSEKTINMNNYLAAIEAGLRSKTAAEMQLERRTAAASQQSAQASGSLAEPGRNASGKAA